MLDDWPMPSRGLYLLAQLGARCADCLAASLQGDTAAKYSGFKWSFHFFLLRAKPFHFLS